MSGGPGACVTLDWLPFGGQAAGRPLVGGGVEGGGGVCVSVCQRKRDTDREKERVRKKKIKTLRHSLCVSLPGPNVPVGGIMPGDMRPGTEWGMMWGFSGEVTLWVLFGGRPGLELEEKWGGGDRKTLGKETFFFLCDDKHTKQCCFFQEDDSKHPRQKPPGMRRPFLIV